MKPILYGAPLSPFVRKIRLQLAFKQVDYDSKMIVPYATPDDYQALNPLRRVPALTLGDDTLADSAVIAQYLDATFPQAPLIPSEPFLRARCTWFEKYADYELAPLMTFAAFKERVLHRINCQPIDDTKVAHAINIGLPPLLDYLESQIDQGHFVGSTLSLADIAIASQLITYAHAGETLDSTQWPKLSAFYESFTALPVVQAIITGEKAQLEKIFARLNTPR